MAEEQQRIKWEGKLSGTLRGMTAEQVWPLLADFCSIDRWMPIVATCSLVGGVNGEPGCVRRCAGPGNVQWANEVLKSIDHAGRKLSYVVTENSLGWGFYEATIEVCSDGEDGGCRLDWSFVMDPLDGAGQEGVVALLASSLEGICKRMEEFLHGGPQDE